MRPIAFFAAVVLLSPWSAFAADGDRDVTFDGDGQVTWNDGGAVSIADVATKTTGAYAVGSIDLPSEEPALHFKAFNIGGVQLDQGCAVASGSLFSFATESHGLAGLVDSSGGLVVGGWAAFLGSETTHRALVARFALTAPGCNLDDGFSSNGWVIFDDEIWCDTEDCDVVDLVEIRPLTGAVLAPRIVALVRSTTSAITARYFLLGLTGAGGIDSGFGSSGWKEVTDTGIGVLHDEAQLAVDAVGRLYVLTGRYDPEGSFDLDAVLFRFHPNGTLDTGFGFTTGTWVLGDDGPDDDFDTLPRGVAISSNGYAISQFQQDDEFDHVVSFLNETQNIALGESSLQGTAVTTQGNGRIVAVGEPFNDADGFTLERLILPPVPNLALPFDNSFGDFGFRSHDIDLGGTNSEKATAVTIWNGRVLVAGTASTATTSAGFLLRTQNSYVFADGFDQGTVVNWSDVSGFVFPE